ncbi:hypothetical protein PIB30_079307 [Stylosanthes scabra]|uniref:Uncharacterized protein n=1 Tax=Stylosanthes scabra TaxID=79078 RepID=A0ABU6YQJ9_9FABA|nr:hypothetical protein [Stylosanthes scabra]
MFGPSLELGPNVALVDEERAWGVWATSQLGHVWDWPKRDSNVALVWCGLVVLSGLTFGKIGYESLKSKKTEEEENRGAKQRSLDQRTT